MLRGVQERVAKLTAEVEAKVAEQNKLKQDMERCNVHLERAEKLKVLLADEGVRWEETCK